MSGRAQWMPVVHSVTCVVGDMCRTLDFYRLLGLEVDRSENTRGYVCLDLGGGLRITWSSQDVERSLHAAGDMPEGPGRMGIAFRCTNPEAVDALFERLVDAGHPTVLEPCDAPWGARHCRLLDPDGNPVDLFAPLP